MQYPDVSLARRNGHGYRTWSKQAPSPIGKGLG
jgi:hypothetical protein